MNEAHLRDEDRATRPCPGCSATNANSRILCGACGLDLATGDPEMTVTPERIVARTWPLLHGTDDDATSGIPWWVPVMALVLVVGGLTAAIVGLELGPFAPEEELPPTEFEATRYPDDPESLALSDVATLTSRAPDGPRNFTPQHLVDGDTSSAWHGDGSDLPAGVGEKLDLFLDAPAWVDAVVVDNGDQLDPAAYAETARIQRAVLVFDGDLRVPVTLLDQGLEAQIVELDEPILTSTVRLEIQETVPGTEDADVAVSGLELFGYPAQGDDVVLAQEREAIQPAAGTVDLPG